MLAMLLLALGLIVCTARSVGAEPMGTAFTYQGRLIVDVNDVNDVKVPANGPYDFRFRLYDGPDPNVDMDLGGAIYWDEVEINDGYFTVVLDYGADPNINGEARWLEIGIREGQLEDPNEYQLLWPLQQIMPTPYAIYAQNAGKLDGHSSSYFAPGMHSHHSLDAADGSPKDAVYVDKNGQVGIGTTMPAAELHVLGGKLRVNTAPIGGYASEIDGSTITGMCQGCPPGTDRLHLAVGDNQGSIVMVEGGGNVGIGTANPGAKLDVDGQVRIRGGSPGAGKVLTSNATGLASWQSVAGAADQDWEVVGSDMYSIPSGNVGVGTAMPGAKLHVVGGKLRVNTAMIGGYATEVNGSTITGHCQGCPPGADRLNLGVGDDQGNVVMVKDGGKVGIGTTNPDATLQVNGTMKIFGTWTSRNGGTVYRAGTDGFFVGYATGQGSGTPTITVYTDGSNPPTTVRIKHGIGNNDHFGFNLPVRKDDYYRVVEDDIGSSQYYWLPLGN